MDLVNKEISKNLIMPNIKCEDEVAEVEEAQSNNNKKMKREKQVGQKSVASYHTWSGRGGRNLSHARVPMKILSWNVRGLSSKGRTIDVMKMVTSNKTDIFGLVEIKVKKKNFVIISRKTGMIEDILQTTHGPKMKNLVDLESNKLGNSDSLRNFSIDTFKLYKKEWFYNL